MLFILYFKTYLIFIDFPLIIIFNYVGSKLLNFERDAFQRDKEIVYSLNVDYFSFIFRKLKKKENEEYF